MRNIKIKHSIMVVLMVGALVALSCGLFGESQTPTPTPTLSSASSPSQSPTPGGRCGDRLCDEEEKANPDLCPQDCAPAAFQEDIETNAPPTPSVGTPGSAHVSLQWRSAYGPCQVDDYFAEMDFTWTLNEDGELVGSGEGTMHAEQVSRCSGTEYGGVKTPNPYPVEVTSTVTESGWWVDLVATDNSQAYYTSGVVYREECILCWVLPQYKGLGVSGALSSFSLPRELRPGITFRFVLDYHIPQQSWTNDHTGEGTLEIIEAPH